MATADTEIDIFSRIFQPENGNLSADAARSILELDFTIEDRERMNFLAEKAREGKLTRREDEEFERFLQVGNLLAVMQSKARRSLTKAKKAARS